MKSFLSVLTIGLFLITGAQFASAQLTQDFYKFDDNGVLSEFQITLPDDSTVIKAQFPESRDMEEGYAQIIYADGTIVDFSKSVSWWRDANGNESPGVRHPSSWQAINNWYKDIKTLPSAPAYDSPNELDLMSFTINFPDNASIELSYDDYYEKLGFKYYVDVDKKGSFIKLSQYEGARSLYGSIIRLEQPDLQISGECRNDYDLYEGTIRTKENEVYKGSFKIKINDKEEREGVKSEYLKKVIKSAELFDIQFKRAGIDDVVAYAQYDGRVVDANNKIVAIYSDGSKLDEFDMASVLAAEQGEIDRQKAEAQKQKDQKDKIVSKYGKKNSDAFFAGKLIVGMPWSLVELGVETRSFKDFTFTTLSIDQGSSKCYDLYNFGFYDKVGFVWVKNGVISTIVFY